jgi:hypothetical protein
VYDPRVGQYLQESNQRADKLKAKLQQLADRRVEIEKRKEASCCSWCCLSV